MNEKIIRRATIVFIIGVVMIAIAPFLLTRKLGFFDFSDTGEIGDTIGGITAPIASLLGSLLIFYALQAQIEANKIIQEQMKEQKEGESQKKLIQYLFDQFRILREDINDFTYITYKSDIEGDKDAVTYLTRRGRDAFRQAIVGMKQYKTQQHLDLFDLNPKLSEIKSLLLAIDNLLDQLKHSPLAIEDKKFLNNLISYQYNSKIKHAFDGMEKFKASLQVPCEKCGKIHKGVPDELFEIVSAVDLKLR